VTVVVTTVIKISESVSEVAQMAVADYMFCSLVHAMFCFVHLDNLPSTGEVLRVVC